MPTVSTIRERIAWGYANLAGFQVLLKGTKKPAHFMVRAKLYKGICNGSMSIASLYDDERTKALGNVICAYCGAPEAYTMDHLVPRKRGGFDFSSNLVISCQPCNSSKGAKDVFEWFASRKVFPPVSIMQRYMKLAWEYYASCGQLDSIWPDEKSESPFRLDLLPDAMPDIGSVAQSKSKD